MLLKLILLSLFSLSLYADCTSDGCPIPSVCCEANGLCVSNQDQCTACNPYNCPSGCCKGDSCASSCGGSGDGPSALIFIGVVIAIIVVIVLASLCTKAFYNPPPRVPVVLRVPQQNFAGQQAQPMVAPPYSIPIIEVEAPKVEYAKDAPQREEEEQIFEVAEELNNSEIARHLQKNKEDMIKTALEMQEILVDQGVAPDPRDKIPKA